MAEPSRRKQGLWSLLKKTVGEFLEDDGMSMAAALAYYTFFSLPPLLVIVVAAIGLIYGPQAVQQAIENQIGTLIGERGREQIGIMIKRATRPGSGIVATTVGVVVLLFGATGAFSQLQAALNRAWDVQPDPEQGGLKTFMKKRLLSLGMVLVIGFLLLVSLALTAALSAFGEWLFGASTTVTLAINWIVSLAVITLLFAAMLRWLPDANVAWKDVWLGAAMTAFLFLIGRFLIGYYIGRMNLGVYGVAGSLVVILVWIYYSGIIFFLGAEFTQVWARRHGRRITPEAGAVRVVRETKQVRDGEQSNGAEGQRTEPSHQRAR